MVPERYADPPTWADRWERLPASVQGPLGGFVIASGVALGVGVFCAQLLVEIAALVALGRWLAWLVSLCPPL